MPYKQDPASADITGLLDKPGQLRQSGVLADQEFLANKRALLARL